VERQARHFALPEDTSKLWSTARLVNLEEVEIEALTLAADGAVNLDITKKKIVMIEFLPKIRVAQNSFVITIERIYEAAKGQIIYENL
jgi:hypothetical protein